MKLVELVLRDPWLVALAAITSALLFTFVAAVEIGKDLVRLWWLPARPLRLLPALPAPPMPQEGPSEPAISTNAVPGRVWYRQVFIDRGEKGVQTAKAVAPDDVPLELYLVRLQQIEAVFWRGLGQGQREVEQGGVRA